MLFAGALVFWGAAAFYLLLNGPWLVRRSLAARSGRLSSISSRYSRDTRKETALVIVPCDGQRIDILEKNLRSLCQQRDVRCRIVAVTREHDTRIETLVSRLDATSQHRCRYLVAGRARHCCQKNHNILAAIDQWGDADVYVFCDSDVIVPRASWLVDFIAPLASSDPKGTRVAVTTYRETPTPPRCSVGFLFYKAYNDFMLFGMSLNRFWLWGGATAMRRLEFERHDVARQWNRCIVDDLSLSRLFRRKKLRAEFRYDCMLRECRGPTHTLPSALNWAIRQVQYNRYCVPDCFASILVLPLPVIVAVPLLLWSAISNAEGPLAIGSLLGLGALACVVSWSLSAWLRTLAYPSRYRGILALLAVLLAPLVFLVSAVALLRPYMDWGDLRYRVGSGGTVLHITKRPCRAPRPETTKTVAIRDDGGTSLLQPRRHQSP